MITKIIEILDATIIHTLKLNITQMGLICNNIEYLKLSFPFIKQQMFKQCKHASAFDYFMNSLKLYNELVNRCEN